MRATNGVTGTTVYADESVLRRLGPQWVIEEQKKAAPSKKAPAKKSDK